MFGNCINEGNTYLNSIEVYFRSFISGSIGTGIKEKVGEVF